MTAKKPAKKAPAKKKETRGRKTVFTPIVVQKIEQVAALNGTVEQMAFYAGISRAVLYEKLASDKVFSDRIAGLREKPMLKALETIVNSLGNPGDAKWYAERMDKKSFSLRTEHTGAEGAPLVITPVNYADLAEDPSDTP